MTFPRRQRRRCPAAGPAAALFAAIVTAALPVRLAASTTEYVVADRYTGLAINGFDPVAYFTEGAATPGRAEVECRHAGAVWRFRNEGNRAAFLADPQVYAPRFGGYDPLDVARSVAVPGDPRLWLVFGNRLFLFSRAETRDSFASRPERSSATADSRWRAVQSTLSP
jgi:hypothetical protein